MAGLNPHGAGPYQPETTRSQLQGNFPNPEHSRNEENGRFREGSVDTTQTSRSYTRVGSHMSQKQDDERAMQREINDLKRRSRFAQRRQSPPALTHPSMTKMTTTTGKDPILPQGRLSPTRRSVTKSASVEVPFQGAWGTTP